MGLCVKKYRKTGTLLKNNTLILGEVGIEGYIDREK